VKIQGRRCFERLGHTTRSPCPQASAGTDLVKEHTHTHTHSQRSFVESAKYNIPQRSQAPPLHFGGTVRPGGQATDTRDTNRQSSHEKCARGIIQRRQKTLDGELVSGVAGQKLAHVGKHWHAAPSCDTSGAPPSPLPATSSPPPAAPAALRPRARRIHYARHTRVNVQHLHDARQPAQTGARSRHPCSESPRLAPQWPLLRGDSPPACAQRFLGKALALPMSSSSGECFWSSGCRKGEEFFSESKRNILLPEGRRICGSAG
jgi:hypothetical protein